MSRADVLESEDSLIHAVETPECTDEHFSMLDQLNSPRTAADGGGVRGRAATTTSGASNNTKRSAANNQSGRNYSQHNGGEGDLANDGSSSATGSVSLYHFESTRLGALNSSEVDVDESASGRGDQRQRLQTRNNNNGKTTTTHDNNSSSSRSKQHQQSLLPSDERDQLQEYWIDSNGKRGTSSSSGSSAHPVVATGNSNNGGSSYNIDAHVDDSLYSSPPVFGRRGAGRNRVRRFLVDYVNLGVVGVVLCVVLLGAGLLCRLGPFEYTVHHDVGRFLMSGGIFGLASACSNFLAVKVLLVTMFLSRHESVLQNSVRDIVMNIFFSKDRMEEQLVAHVRKAMSTTSLVQSIQTILAHDRTKVMVKRYLDHVLHYTKEGMMLSMLGVQQDALEPLLMPAVLSTLSDLAPIVSDILLPGDVITPDAFLEAMERVVSHRTTSLDVDDLRGIVAGVLAPHLSILVLWGSLFGIAVGVVAEVFTFSHFLSGCTST